MTGDESIHVFVAELNCLFLLEFAKVHTQTVRCVIIRQTTLRTRDERLLVEAADFFKQNGIAFYYGSELPHDLVSLTQ